MYRALRNAVAICLLVGVAVASWYWSRPAALESRGSESGDIPLGYYLRHAVLLGTDDEGRLLYRINAELAEERPEDGTLLLKGVEVEYQPAEQVPWHVRAATAETATDASYLHLKGDVELEREPGQGRERALVETESLRLEPQRHVAIADGEVSLTVGGQTFEAVGLRAFLKDDRLELGKVHGRFLP